MRKVSRLLDKLQHATGRRPVFVSGRIHTVTDMRTGERVRVSVQSVARDGRGRIKTVKVLAR